MTSATGLTPLHGGPRASLLFWGGGLLVAGLALVGVGAGAEGAPLALAGLFNTIYGIHVFGRLGPDDQGTDEAEAGVSCAIWTGTLTALAGFLVVVDHQGGAGDFAPWALTAYGLCVVGAVRVVRGRREARRLREVTAEASGAKAATGGGKKGAGGEKRRRKARD